jgi:Tfp pilus assembly protein PilF
VSKHLISLFLLAGTALSACATATQYDTGAVVLDVSEPAAFTSGQETTPEFRSAYDAMKTEDYTRAEALLDRALAQKPKDPYALLAMGSVHERTGRFYSAADYYRSAVRYGDAAAGPSLTSGKETASQASLTVGDVARGNLERLKK